MRRMPAPLALTPALSQREREQNRRHGGQRTNALARWLQARFGRPCTGGGTRVRVRVCVRVRVRVRVRARARALRAFSAASRPAVQLASQHPPACQPARQRFGYPLPPA